MKIIFKRVFIMFIIFCYYLLTTFSIVFFNKICFDCESTIYDLPTFIGIR